MATVWCRPTDTADVATLAELRKVIPAAWLDCAAVGSAEACAQRVRGQFDLGVDGVIMHGATPRELEPVIRAYAEPAR